jgi:penicillin-binding protein 1A
MRPTLRQHLRSLAVAARGARWPRVLLAQGRRVFGAGTPPKQRMKLAVLGLAGLAATSLGLLLLHAAVLLPFTPSVGGLLAARHEKPSVLLAVDGSTITRFRRSNREWMPLAKVPQHTIDALIATEDHRFFQHGGVDWRRTLASVWHTLRGDRQGGSTLTQQLARNAYPEQVGRSATVARKLKEMITALKIEARYSKAEILEAYLNSTPFLYNAVGLEMAARTYFDKPAAKLDLLEGATLVGMLKGTSAYNPVLNPERARERRNVVLAQMVRHGKLPQKTYDALARRPLKLDFARQDLDDNPAPHFVEAVRRFVQAWAEPLGYDLLADGLVIHATLDPRLQHQAVAAVARQTEALQAVADVEWATPGAKLLATSAAPYRQARSKVTPFAHYFAARPDLLDAFISESPEYAARIAAGASRDDALAQLRADKPFVAALRERKTRLEAGLVAIDPATGHVKAWVGSRDHAIDRFDHVQQARRQPGSTFKPFVYGAALEAGVDPERSFSAQRVSVVLPDGERWRPRDSGEAADSGNGTESGEISLEDGLVHSRNTVAAQLVAEVGAARVADFARRAGVRDSRLDAVPSLALGTSPVSLLEMASGYATLAALGERREPLFVTRITDRDGRLLARFESLPEPAIQQEVAVRLIDMLRGAVDRGTGQAIRSRWGIRADVAGKTGTSQNNADGWFLLMHPQLVVGAWVGFNDPRVTMRSDHWGQGGHNALHLVGDFTAQAIAARAIDPAARFPPPPTEGLGAVFARVGETFRRLFGFGGDPR